MENNDKYSLTPNDIDEGINRILADAYSSSTVSYTPTIIYISGGPGAGKTAVESYFKKQFKEKGSVPRSLKLQTEGQDKPILIGKWLDTQRQVLNKYRGKEQAEIEKDEGIEREEKRRVPAAIL